MDMTDEKVCQENPGKTKGKVNDTRADQPLVDDLDSDDDIEGEGDNTDPAPDIDHHVNPAQNATPDTAKEEGSNAVSATPKEPPNNMGRQYDEAGRFRSARLQQKRTENV